MDKSLASPQLKPSSIVFQLSLLLENNARIPRKALGGNQGNLSLKANKGITGRDIYNTNGM